MSADPQIVSAVAVKRTLKGIEEYIVETPYPADREKLEAELNRICKEFDPDGKIFYVHGYYFITSTKFQKERRVICPESPFKGQIYGSVISKHTEVFEALDEKTKREILKTSEDEYKIHLMPKTVFIIPVLKILLQFFKSNPEVLKYIHGVKIAENPGVSTRDGYMPEIVIYPILGKEYAEKVLSEIMNLFAKHADILGSGLNARFSKQKDALVTYAHSGGDIKKKLGPGERERYLTASGAHLKGSIVSRDPRLVVREVSVRNDLKLENAGTEPTEMDIEKNDNSDADEKEIMEKEHQSLDMLKETLSKIMAGRDEFLRLDVIEEDTLRSRHIFLETSKPFVSSAPIKALKIVLEANKILCETREIATKRFKTNAGKASNTKKYYFRIFLPKSFEHMNTADFSSQFLAAYQSELKMNLELKPAVDWNCFAFAAAHKQNSTAAMQLSNANAAASTSASAAGPGDNVNDADADADAESPDNQKPAASLKRKASKCLTF